MGSENLCDLRNLPQHKVVNLDFVLSKSLLECAHHIWRLLIRNPNESRRQSGQAFDFPEVIDLIRRDAEQAVGSKRAMNRGEKIPRDHATAPMPPFGPGIGKHQMKQCDGLRWQHVLNSIRSLDPENTRVRESASRNITVRLAHPSQEPFDSEKISFWIACGEFREKGSISASKIDLKRSTSTINSLQIERLEIIRRNNLHGGSQSRKLLGLKHLN